MGYLRINIYGDTVETYQYERPIKKKGIDALKAHRLQNSERAYRGQRSNSLESKRRKAIKLQAKANGSYERSTASINRSRKNFFRLCHHNNCLAKTIHFMTLTFQYDITYKEANRSIKRFMERIKKVRPDLSLSYISVPELTKKNRYHFHLLVYNLPPETTIFERKTRNFQRQFQRGFVDVSVATYSSEGIAGYMAKYMAKALRNEKIGSTRGYNCSRNIDKDTSIGGNSLGGYVDLIVPPESIDKIVLSDYDVPYLGKCQFKKIIKKHI